MVALKIFLVLLVGGHYINVNAGGGIDVVDIASSSNFKNDASKYGAENALSSGTTYSCTNLENNPWLHISIKPFKLGGIVVYVPPKLGSKFKNVLVRAGSKSSPLKNPIMAHFKGPGKDGSRYILAFKKAVTVSHIVIQIKGKGMLACHEVQLLLPGDDRLKMAINKGGSGGKKKPAKTAAASGGSASYGGRIYKFDNKPSSRDGARKACAYWGGHLAFIRNAKDNDFIKSQLAKRHFSSAWIGLSDISCEGKFINQITYNHFRKGQPDNSHNEDCVEMAFGWFWNGQWNDLKCKEKRHYVCQRGAELRYVKQGKNWNDAEKDCRHWGGGNLVCITSTAQHDKIYKEARRKGLGSLWTGMTDAACEGHFSCSAGGWNNFKSGEPNGGRGENCVSVNGKTGKWSTEGCNKKQGFICEKAH